MLILIHKLILKVLQGRVQFPPGGKVREPIWQNWCNSSTDSKVWMKEGKVVTLFKVYLCIVLIELLH